METIKPISPPESTDPVDALVGSYIVFKATGATFMDFVRSMLGDEALFPNLVRAIARIKEPLGAKLEVLSEVLARRKDLPSLRFLLDAESFPAFSLCVYAAHQSGAKKGQDWAMRMGYPQALAKAIRAGGVVQIQGDLDYLPSCVMNTLHIENAGIPSLSRIRVQNETVILDCPDLSSVEHSAFHGDLFRFERLPKLANLGSSSIQSRRVQVTDCPVLPDLAVLSPERLAIQGTPLIGGLAVFNLVDGKPEFQAGTKLPFVISISVEGVKGPLLLPEAIYGSMDLKDLGVFSGFPSKRTAIIHELRLEGIRGLRGLACQMQGDVTVQGCPDLQSLDFDLVFLSSIPDDRGGIPQLFPKDGSLQVYLDACPKLRNIASKLDRGIVVASIRIQGCPNLKDIPDWMKDFFSLQSPSYAFLP